MQRGAPVAGDGVVEGVEAVARGDERVGDAPHRAGGESVGLAGGGVHGVGHQVGALQAARALRGGDGVAEVVARGAAGGHADAGDAGGAVLDEAKAAGPVAPARDLGVVGHQQARDARVVAPLGEAVPADDVAGVRARERRAPRVQIFCALNFEVNEGG